METGDGDAVALAEAEKAEVGDVEVAVLALGGSDAVDEKFAGTVGDDAFALVGIVQLLDGAVDGVGLELGRTGAHEACDRSGDGSLGGVVGVIPFDRARCVEAYEIGAAHLVLAIVRRPEADEGDVVAFAHIEGREGLVVVRAVAEVGGRKTVHIHAAGLIHEVEVAVLLVGQVEDLAGEAVGLGGGFGSCEELRDRSGYRFRDVRIVGIVRIVGVLGFDAGLDAVVVDRNLGNPEIAAVAARRKGDGSGVAGPDIICAEGAVIGSEGDDPVIGQLRRKHDGRDLGRLVAGGHPSGRSRGSFRD